MACELTCKFFTNSRWRLSCFISWALVGIFVHNKIYFYFTKTSLNHCNDTMSTNCHHWILLWPQRPFHEGFILRLVQHIVIKGIFHEHSRIFHITWSTHRMLRDVMLCDHTWDLPFSFGTNWNSIAKIIQNTTNLTKTHSWELHGLVWGTSFIIDPWQWKLSSLLWAIFLFFW